MIEDGQILIEDENGAKIIGEDGKEVEQTKF